jgi:AraC-like DNA-binding protein
VYPNAGSKRLNEYSLKQGFQRVFGKPVFEYLHGYRLEQARQLLETGHFEVTEAAKRVGFDDHSYFAASFRKKFGINPKAYLMQRRLNV